MLKTFFLAKNLCLFLKINYQSDEFFFFIFELKKKCYLNQIQRFGIDYILTSACANDWKVEKPQHICLHASDTTHGFTCIEGPNLTKWMWIFLFSLHSWVEYLWFLYTMDTKFSTINMKWVQRCHQWISFFFSLYFVISSTKKEKNLKRIQKVGIS